MHLADTEKLLRFSHYLPTYLLLNIGSRSILFVMNYVFHMHIHIQPKRKAYRPQIIEEKQGSITYNMDWKNEAS